MVLHEDFAEMVKCVGQNYLAALPSIGKCGAIRAHCASENQKKSAIAVLHQRTESDSRDLGNPRALYPLMGPDPSHFYFRYCHIRKQTAARRSLLKELSAPKHLLFLPSLIALLVKESGAISEARIGSREAFNALMAV